MTTSTEFEFLSSRSMSANGKQEARTALPQLEVRFQHLSLSAEIRVAPKATNELPTVPNTIRKALQGMLRESKQCVQTKHILRDVSGVFKPGTMTLVLGQPGSGKSALMKALAGRFPMAGNITMEGEVTYNGKAQKEVKHRLPQMVGYVPQRDVHFAMLSVKETLEFAQKCSGGSRGMQSSSTTTDKMIQQLGLENCADTVVGDTMLRGISGGECKRVTLGEMTFGDKRVLLLDEISTGLDSAATFDIIKSYHKMVTETRETIVMVLLQPSPTVFALFDQVLLLDQGYIIYYGPQTKAVEYFEGLGFACPPHRDVADFLLDLGTNQQHQYEVDRQDGRLHPCKAHEFATEFEVSTFHVSMMEELDSPTEANLLQDNAHYFDCLPAFRQSFWASTWTLVVRHLTLTFRNRTFIQSRAFMVVIVGLLYGSVFWNLDIKNVQVSSGILFVSLLFLLLGQITQIPVVAEAREKFYKQRGANFYRTSSYVIASSIAQIPMCLLETLLYGSLVYWMCGFVNSVKLYILYEALILAMIFCFSAFFFLICAIAPNMSIAKPVAMVAMVFFSLYSGFVLMRGRMPAYSVWIYWIDPVAWSARALIASQYRDARFDVDEYDGINYKLQFGKQMGEYSLSLFDVPSEKIWIWLGFVVMMIFYALFMTLACLVLEYKRYESPENVDLGSKEQSDEEREGFQSTTSSGNSSEVYIVMETPHYIAPNDMAVDMAPAAHEQRFTPVTLAFKDLWYSVPDPHHPKETIDLLKGVSGFALPRKMTALMGSTGAGKTTLMDVIAGRKTGGKIRGDILLNGHPATRLAIQRSTGYCEQKDIHSDGSTFREALTFSVFLRQGSSIPNELKLESVEECLDLLDLRPIADQIIRGSSVEQMKRLTIGVEVAAQPSVLFLDEPTSGLDARSAKTIMDGVRKIADTGRTIVCTIHQPSKKGFQLFDSLLLLKKGGQTVFFGDLGLKATDLIHYFEDIPSTRPIEKGANPATWMLEVIGAGVGNTQGQETDFVSAFNASDKSRLMNAMLNQEGVGCVASSRPALIFAQKRAASSITQMKYLIERFFTLYWRTSAYTLTRMVISVVLALLMGISYLNIDYTSYQGINSGQGMIAMTTNFIGMASLVSVIPIASEDRAAFYRERSSQTYNVFWYFMGSTVAEIPFVFGCTLAFLAIDFPMLGFSGVTRFLLYWCGLSLHLLLLTYFGMLLVYALPNMESAMVTGTLFNTVSVLFMGSNPPSANIPSAYKWLYQLVPHHYSFAIQMTSVFGNCNLDDPTDLSCRSISNLPPALPSHLNIEQYISTIFQVDNDDLTRNFGILIAWIVVVRILGLLALRFVNHQSN